MKEKKLRRKLRKKAEKLERFAKRNGIESASFWVYTGIMPSVAIYCDMDNGSKVQCYFEQDGEDDA